MGVLVCSGIGHKPISCVTRSCCVYFCAAVILAHHLQPDTVGPPLRQRLHDSASSIQQGRYKTAEPLYPFTLSAVIVGAVQQFKFRIAINCTIMHLAQIIGFFFLVNVISPVLSSNLFNVSVLYT